MLLRNAERKIRRCGLTPDTFPKHVPRLQVLQWSILDRLSGCSPSSKLLKELGRKVSGMTAFVAKAGTRWQTRQAIPRGELYTRHSKTRRRLLHLIAFIGVTVLSAVIASRSFSHQLHTFRCHAAPHPLSTCTCMAKHGQDDHLDKIALPAEQLYLSVIVSARLHDE